jgi:hypothetical protein
LELTCCVPSAWEGSPEKNGLLLVGWPSSRSTQELSITTPHWPEVNSNSGVRDLQFIKLRLNNAVVVKRLPAWEWL